jgi:hypothetical protein
MRWVARMVEYFLCNNLVIFANVIIVCSFLSRAVVASIGCENIKMKISTCVHEMPRFFVRQYFAPFTSDTCIFFMSLTSITQKPGSAHEY